MTLGKLDGASWARIARSAPVLCVRLWALFLVLSIGATMLGQSVEAQSYRFTNVQIEGNQRIGDAAIVELAGIQRGETVDAGAVNDAFQRLQSSGLFESVNVEPRGSTLRITVVEFPTINRISFEGNRRINDEQLGAVIDSTPRRVFNPAQAERDAANISTAYSQDGRLSARVTPRIIRRSDNRVDLVFEILEGDVVEIERLSFVGNRVFSDRRLRRVLETKQAGLLRAFIRRDTLVQERIQVDQRVLRDFYLSRGYVDFRILSVNSELAQTRDGFFLVFNLEEGQQFRFGKITTTSEMSGVDPAPYQESLRVRPGVVYSPALVENSIARMERLAIRNGVDFMRVEPRITRNERDLTLDVEFALVQGPRVFIERIDIEGNTTTLDRVVRRQFRVVEGDPLNPREVRESAERIRALGFFSDAKVEAREGSSPDQVIIDVDVEEQPTGSLSFGGAFSSNDGFGLVANFRESNFLGRGQRLAFTISTAEEAGAIGFGFTEPALLGRDLVFNLDVSYSENDSSFSSYDVERLRIRPSLTFPVRENARLSLRYTAENVKLLERDPPESGVVVGREIALGDRWNSSIGYTYTYDTRVSGLNPNAGFLLEFGQDFGGIGGDNQFIQTRARAVAQTRVLNEEVTLRATVEGGMLNWIDGDNRVSDRFLLSQSIMRGFEPGGIGPRDLSTDDDPLGGNLFVVARFEAEFPLGLPEELGISGGVFYDVGNLWDLSDVNTSGGTIVGESGSFRHVVGVSLFWDTPIGPLRFNLSDAIVKEDFDKEQTFDLTLSTQF